MKIEIPKKNISVSEEKKEKSCAKKDKEKEFQKAPSGVGVIPTLQEVQEYFILKKVAAIEGEKFFNYYESTGWLVGGKTKMKNWYAASRNWMLNVQGYNHEKQTLQEANNLNVSKNKNYNEPL